MKTFNFFQPVVVFFTLIIILIVACEKETEVISNETTTRTFVYKGTEYVVGLEKKGNEYSLVENGVTEFLGKVLDIPTSGIYIDQETEKVYLFGTYEEADLFFEEIRNTYKLKSAKTTNVYLHSCAEFFSSADGWNHPENVIDSISECYFPIPYTKLEYEYPYLTQKGCNDMIASIWMHGGINGIGLTITLCQHVDYSGERLYLYTAPGDNDCVNLKDYVMIKRLFSKTHWDYQASSMYINI